MNNRPQNTSLRQAALLLIAATFVGACSRPSCCEDACDCSASTAPATARSTAAERGAKPADAPRKHPLKGVITDILPDRSALMVKHEEIPGVMKAMTMMFTVDPTVLKSVKKGDAITAQLSRQGDDWILESIQVQ